jgi:hypothetical protein
MEGRARTIRHHEDAIRESGGLAAPMPSPIIVIGRIATAEWEDDPRTGALTVERMRLEQ